MLWVSVLAALAVSAAGSPFGGITFLPFIKDGEETAPHVPCAAPSGQAGDCKIAKLCSGGSGSLSKEPCAKGRPNLLFCCEREVHVKNSLTASPTTLPTDCGVGGNMQSRRRRAIFNQPSSAVVKNIFNGEDADQGDWPWAVALGVRQEDDTIRWVCGGSLITSGHVLTAAHCRTFDPLDRLVVRVGEHNLAIRSDGQHQDLAVRRAVQHPDFRASHNDMMVLHLATPARLDENVQPVCLPQPETTFVGRSGLVVGWGQLNANDRNSQPEILQQALVKVVPTDTCETTYSEGTSQFTTRFPQDTKFPEGGFGGRVLCASSGQDACQGDSGGPLSIQTSDGRWRLAGVVLLGIGCGNPDFPGLYTRTASYVEWIKQEVAKP